MQPEIKYENGVYSLGSMQAEVIRASKPSNGAPPIFTIRTRHPRIIHPEWMTHRLFSRNARSSRAVPVAKMLDEVRTDPFVPWHWGANMRGMQALEECNEPVYFKSINVDDPQPGDYSREEAWLEARDRAVEMAEAFMNAGYHKQIANRLLEPFMWIEVLTTSTSWENFFHLRDHEDAEPHIRDLAVLVKTAFAGAEIELIGPNNWHLPYITDEDQSAAVFWINKQQPPHNIPEWSLVREILCRISAARCARISYAPFDGNGSIERELERYDLLVGSHPLHASPCEHQCTPDNGITNGQTVHWESEHLSGNLGPGWIQYRKMLPGEFMPG